MKTYILFNNKLKTNHRYEERLGLKRRNVTFYQRKVATTVGCSVIALSSSLGFVL